MMGRARTIVLQLAVAMSSAWGCSQTHQAAERCDPSLGESACPEGFSCRPDYTGEAHFCMRRCWGMFVCDTGEVCIGHPEGEGAVCYLGGPVTRGEPCDRHQECARELACNRDGVCEELCDSLDPDYDCLGEGLECEYSICQTPAPLGAPCTRVEDCSPSQWCASEALYTCQDQCHSGFPLTCSDGTECRFYEDCFQDEFTPIDLCERTDAGSMGCEEGEACILTPQGVRRCMKTGCHPDGTGTPCGRPCLADPEDPDTLVCWIAAGHRLGQACETHYDCLGNMCNREGVCSYECTTEGEPCPTLEGYVCRDFACTPE